MPRAKTLCKGLREMGFRNSDGGNSAAVVAADDTMNKCKTAKKVPKGSNETKTANMSFDIVDFAAAGISCTSSSAGARGFYENCGANSLSETMLTPRLVRRSGFAAA